MASLLNQNRPPLYCPGCSHDKMTRVLDTVLQELGISGEKVGIVSDIGCNGQFDTFFNTHAFHGLHGRALTYATGIKLAQPELNVIVTMGDGGMGIGGAHFNAACRRNLDLTLLVLNNFNFGMTGGQYSATTPTDAIVGTGFLNHLEPPLDICDMARSTGATFVQRISAYHKDLKEVIKSAISHKGMSVLDIWGICTGRYTKKNTITPETIDANIENMNGHKGIIRENSRPEYGVAYRKATAEAATGFLPKKIPACFDLKTPKRQKTIILGNAGQRILTAGEILCYAGMSAGLQATKKDEYNITVLRGPSICEVILSPGEIDYTGIKNPSVVVAIAQEGVDRRLKMLKSLTEDTLLICAADLKLPATSARTQLVDFKKLKIKSADRALACLAIMAAGLIPEIKRDMLLYALAALFHGDILKASLDLVSYISNSIE